MSIQFIQFLTKNLSGDLFLVGRCRVRHNAKQAATLNSASSKFRNDIIEVIIATYRLKGYLLDSGNKVGIAHFETSKFRCHSSDG